MPGVVCDVDDEEIGNCVESDGELNVLLNKDVVVGGEDVIVVGSEAAGVDVLDEGVFNWKLFISGVGCIPVEFVGGVIGNKVG